MIVGKLKKPENSNQKDKCEKAQEYLSNDLGVYVNGNLSEIDKWPLPSEVEEINEEISKVWYVYEDNWPFDEDPDFRYSVNIPSYVLWGKKKREKYLKSR